LYAEAENGNVDINHILTDLQDDPGYSDLLDIKPVDRRAQGPGWVSLANTEIQVRKQSIKGGNIPTTSNFEGFKIVSPEKLNFLCFCYIY